MSHVLTNCPQRRLGGMELVRSVARVALSPEESEGDSRSLVVMSSSVRSSRNRLKMVPQTDR